jgi:uncharacterized protein YoxC
MNNIFLGIITLAAVVLVAYVIYMILNLKRTLASLDRFIETTETTLQPALEELQATLKSVRKVTDDVGTLTDDIRHISGSVRNIGETMDQVSYAVKSAADASISETRGLKAGIRAGVSYFLRNVCARGGTR